jgi:drug/metabolite transporter (DMT)-like permease
MVLAGVSWGAYTLLGRGSAAPLAATAGNFVRAVPLALLPCAATALVSWAAPDAAAATPLHASATGVALAAASGAITSGLGYAIWYAALRRLSTLRAATVQLSVPLIAAVGGVLLLGEAITPRLAVASLAILGGIAIVLAGRSRRTGGAGKA